MPTVRCGQFIELHKNTVAGEFVNFPKPQDMGNHEDVRWCALTDPEGEGAVFVAADRLSVSALQYSALDLIFGFSSLPIAGCGRYVSAFGCGCDRAGW